MIEEIMTIFTRVGTIVKMHEAMLERQLNLIKLYYLQENIN